MGVESSHVLPGAPTCRVGTLSLIGYCLLSFLVCWMPGSYELLHRGSNAANETAVVDRGGRRVGAGGLKPVWVVGLSRQTVSNAHQGH